MSPSEHAGISRIVERLCQLRGGNSVPDGNGWRIEVPASEDQPELEGFSFHQRIEGNVLSNDARIDRVNIVTARAMAVFQRELAEALVRERVSFSGLADIAAFLGKHVSNEVRDFSGEGYVVVVIDKVWLTTITMPEGRDERWIEVAMQFPDTDADWLLAANGRLIGFAFERAGDSVGLRTTVPLAAVTGQRLIEMIFDLLSRHELLREELDLEDDEDDDESDLWTEDTAIVGPYENEAACRSAFDFELIGLGATPLTRQVDGCATARVYEVDGTFWISGSTYLAARLMYELEDARAFGVTCAWDDNEEHIVEVWLRELGLDEDGDLVVIEDLGEEPEQGDEVMATRHWEGRLAARAVESEDDVKTKYVWWYLDAPDEMAANDNADESS